jgi:hypothetical protein
MGDNKYLYPWGTEATVEALENVSWEGHGAKGLQFSGCLVYWGYFWKCLLRAIAGRLINSQLPF